MKDIETIEENDQKMDGKHKKDEGIGDQNASYCYM